MMPCRFVFFAGVWLALLPALVRADEEKPKEAQKNPAKKTVTLAHIKLSGSMTEQAPNVDPLLGQLGETFKQKIDRLRKVAQDKEVQALLLEIDGVSAGWGKLHELSQAIEYVRKSGKKVYAHVEGGNRPDYLLALAADEVCIPESAWVMLTGLRAEATFYKGLLDLLGIKADMLQMGDYKGANEPFTRDSLSEANREQITSILDDTFQHDIIERIAKARKLTNERVRELIDEGPFSARAALKAGLVDRLDYVSGYEQTIKKQLGGDSFKVLRDYAKKKDAEELSIFDLYKKLIWGPTKTTSTRTPKVALIYATGAISTGKSGSSLMGGETMGSETMVKAIQEAAEDTSVKAIVLRIDSPGGSALASDLIWNALKECKKPVIASMSDVAGSGGYYIAMCADKIYAEPGTITGSIGVVGGKMVTKGLFEKVGIKTEVISRGRNSGLFGDELFSPSEKETFRALMQDTYDQFIDKAVAGRVAAGQKMTREELLKLAGGRIYTGRQAKKNGLIDEIGTLEDAIVAAAKMGGLPADKEPELLLLPKPRNALDSLLSSAFGTELAVDPKLLKAFPELAQKLRGVDALLSLRHEPVWAIVPFRLEIK